MAEIKAKKLRLKNQQEVVLRSPTLADAHAFVEYLRVMRHESHLNMNYPPLKPGDAQCLEPQIAKRFEEGAEFLLLAFEEGAVIGSFNLKPETSPYLFRCASIGMAVLNVYQGLGLGTALLDYGLAQAALLGRTNITLHVRTFNERAIKLYEKCGFRRVGTLFDYADIDGVKCDEFVYQRIAMPPGQVARQ